MCQIKWAILVCFAALICSPRVIAQSLPDYITVHGRRFHAIVKGHGKIPVIFESGLGEDFSTWKAVQPEVARSALTLSYDRLGLGLSSPATGTRDGIRLAAELHELLHALKLSPPYLLVGHSLGGAVVEIFSSRYPKEVAGLVLVDPEDGRLVDQLRGRLSAQEWEARSQALAKYGPMPPPVKREYDDMLKSSAKMQTLSPLPKVPIVLLTATQIDSGFPGNPLEQQIKFGLHREFLAHNPQAEQVLVPETRHYIQTDAPAKVVDAVLRVLAARLIR